MIVERFRVMECRGDLVKQIIWGTRQERGLVGVFYEARRMGSVPPYSRQWCIERGIYPSEVLGDKPKESPS